MKSIIYVQYMSDGDLDKSVTFTRWMVRDMQRKNSEMMADAYCFWDEGSSSYEEFLTRYLLRGWSEYARLN